MSRQKLINQIRTKKSMLCVGLDSDISKIPERFLKEQHPQFAFNRYIVEETAEFAVAFKPNLAFYESQGAKGFEELKMTVDFIRKNYPDIFLIADAKRGDIGNTSKHYAKTFFEYFDFDAVTLSPYMGEDVVKPFLEYENKWVILLGLTSNTSAGEVQFFENRENKKFFEHIITLGQKWGTPENTMFVVGATKAEYLNEIRTLTPDNFFLVPGIGAQGGDLEMVIRNGKNADGGLLINSSRGIIFAENPKQAAKNLQEQMVTLL
ncbi:MAG: orotidine-5'-phosphate decarboxylase [Bacteroidales bacterium]|nr:orotidine-5'-phosphate decarboxylase [Bacteroidales bacterium]